MINKELTLLDQIEEIRQKAAENPQNYPIDNTIRLISAKVAKYLGYDNRNDWINELKRHPDSKYAARLSKNRLQL